MLTAAESGWIQRNPMNLKRQSPVTISMLLFTNAPEQPKAYKHCTLDKIVEGW